MENNRPHVISDDDLGIGKAAISHIEAVRVIGLTPEEKVIERTLLRKIDGRILPVVILVYLMNYIDR